MTNNYYASDALNKDVKDSSGDTVGSVDDMVISPDGRVEYIIISYDGIFGTSFNDKKAALPYEQCGWDDASQSVTIQLTQEQLKLTPNFDKNNVPQSHDSYYDDVRSYYRDNRQAA